MKDKDDVIGHTMTKPPLNLIRPSSVTDKVIRNVILFFISVY
jgi:hypothetical protein